MAEKPKAKVRERRGRVQILYSSDEDDEGIIPTLMDIDFNISHCQFSGFSFILFLVSFLVKNRATQIFL